MDDESLDNEMIENGYENLASIIESFGEEIVLETGENVEEIPISEKKAKKKAKRESFGKNGLHKRNRKTGQYEDEQITITRTADNVTEKFIEKEHNSVRLGNNHDSKKAFSSKETRLSNEEERTVSDLQCQFCQREC